MKSKIAGMHIETAAQAATLFSDVAKIAGAQEGFFVLPLDYGGKILALPIMVSIGDKDGMVAVNPKDVFK